MILVTGGSGFIGSHTVRALYDLGENSVVVQRSSGRQSPILADVPYVTEQVDVTDRAALLAVGERHEITGILHLAGSMPWPAEPERPVEAAQHALGGLFNIIDAAQKWGVHRVGVASTIGVYTGLEVSGPLSEELPLPMTAPHVIPTFKKVGELLGGHLEDVTGIEIVALRISGTWGPLGHKVDPFFAGPSLIHAAAFGREPELAGPAFLENALDLCYVRDTGRAIALLQTAERLNHRTYNVGSGHSTSNRDVVAAIRQLIPEAAVELPSGGHSSSTYLDITRLRDDTRFEPEYDTSHAAADYLRWLQDGHDA